MSFLIMSIYEKPKLTANITLHGERLEISLQRHEHNKDICSLHLYSPSPVFICRLFDDGYSNYCEVIPHCSFDLHFSNNLQC